jgi:DNA-binding response OmpR family regulator
MLRQQKGFLVKPFEIQEVLGRINRLLSFDTKQTA